MNKRDFGKTVRPICSHCEFWKFRDYLQESHEGFGQCMKFTTDPKETKTSTQRWTSALDGCEEFKIRIDA